MKKPAWPRAEKLILGELHSGEYSPEQSLITLVSTWASSGSETPYQLESYFMVLGLHLNVKAHTSPFWACLSVKWHFRMCWDRHPARKLLRLFHEPINRAPDTVPLFANSGIFRYRCLSTQCPIFLIFTHYAASWPGAYDANDLSDLRSVAAIPFGNTLISTSENGITVKPQWIANAEFDVVNHAGRGLPAGDQSQRHL